MVLSLRVWAVSVPAACSPVGLVGQCVAPTFSGGVGLGDSTGSAPLRRAPEPEHVGAGEALRPRQGRELLRQGPGRAGGVQRGGVWVPYTRMFCSQHQQCQQRRTPSPLVVEGTAERSSPPLSPSTKVGQAPNPAASSSLLLQPGSSPGQAPNREPSCSLSARALCPCPPPTPSIQGRRHRGREAAWPLLSFQGSRLCLPCTAHRQDRVPDPLHREEVSLTASLARPHGSPREARRGGGDLGAPSSLLGQADAPPA